MTKLKYENIIFAILVLGSMYNATLISNDGVFGVHSAFFTLLVQITCWEFARLGLRYIRKNPKAIKKSWQDLFKD